jgi:peroxiredoxin
MNTKRMNEKNASSAPNLAVDSVAFANSYVLDAQNRRLKLGQLWQSQPVIFIFLRHFACIACRAHAAEVWKNRGQYEQTGSRLVFVGNGAPEYIDAFKTELGLETALILTDPSLESFRAAGFRHGFFEIVQLKSLLNAIRLAADGNKQTSLSAEGSHWQLGGVLAINKSGKLLYRFVSQALGDFPSEEDLNHILQAESESLRAEKEASRSAYLK